MFLTQDNADRVLLLRVQHVGWCVFLVCPVALRGSLSRRSTRARGSSRDASPDRHLLLFFFTLVTGPRRSLSLKLSDARVCEPEIRVSLVTTARGTPLPTGIRPQSPFFFFFTFVAGPSRSLSLKLSDTIVYEPHIQGISPQSGIKSPFLGP